MDLKNISDQVLNKIKKDHIKPKQRWRFLLKDYVVWLLSFISLIIGSLAISVIIYLTKYNDWDLYQYIDDSWLKFALLSLPYLWILFLIIFVLTVNYNFRHTKGGYRYGTLKVVIFTVFLSMLFGLFLYNIGAGQAIDGVFSKKIPFYEELFQGRRMRWLMPDRGLLAGKVLEVYSENNFSLIDFNSNEWDVNAGENSIMPMVIIRANEHLRMVGEKIDEKRFKAARILPGDRPMRRWFRDKPCVNNNSCPLMHTDKRSPEIDKIREMKIKDAEMIGKECASHEECRVPFMYAVRSVCPFESKCIDNICAVICPDYYDSEEQELRGEPMCANNKDCDCAHFDNSEKLDCVCIEGKCGAVVAR